MTYVVAVTGGRDYANREHVWRTLDEIHAERTIDLLVTGGCRGADRLAGKWADAHGVCVAEFTPNWAKYGRAAGPRRNEWMLRESQASLLVAFPGGKGTDGCIEIARRMGIAIRDERGHG